MRKFSPFNEPTSYEDDISYWVFTCTKGREVEKGHVPYRGMWDYDGGGLLSLAIWLHKTHLLSPPPLLPNCALKETAKERGGGRNQCGRIHISIVWGKQQLPKSNSSNQASPIKWELVWVDTEMTWKGILCGTPVAVFSSLSVDQICTQQWPLELVAFQISKRTEERQYRNEAARAFIHLLSLRRLVISSIFCRPGFQD